MNNSQRFSVWFAESSASMPPTTQTKHTDDTRQRVLVGAIDKMNEAHFLPIDVSTTLTVDEISQTFTYSLQTQRLLDEKHPKKNQYSFPVQIL